MNFVTENRHELTKAKKMTCFNRNFEIGERPDAASQKRFSWFSDWIQAVQKCADLVDLQNAAKKMFGCESRLRYNRERTIYNLTLYLKFPEVRWSLRGARRTRGS